jgi:hypothetical protein
VLLVELSADLDRQVILAAYTLREHVEAFVLVCESQHLTPASMRPLGMIYKARILSQAGMSSQRPSSNGHQRQNPDENGTVHTLHHHPLTRQHLPITLPLCAVRIRIIRVLSTRIRQPEA